MTLEEKDRLSARTPSAGAGEVAEEAAFLCARLRTFESCLMDDDPARQFFGHVSPSIARLEGILSTLREGERQS